MSAKTENTATLEDKLLRLQAIQQILEQQKIGLKESLEMVKEALALKKEIETELSEMENQIIQITAKEEGVSA